jgi:tetratricopeptide (TPR) repeat protein
MAIIYSDWGDSDRALDYGQRCLEAFEAAGDLAGSVRARHNVGILSRRADDWTQAAEHYREGLRLGEMMGDGMLIGMFANSMGLLYLDQGKLDEAAAAFQRSIAVWQPTGYLRGVAAVHINLGRVAILQGELETGQTHLSEALTVAQEIGARTYLPEIHRWQALVVLAQHRYEDALTLARQAHDLALEVKDRIEEGGSLRVLGQVFAALGQKDQAIEHLEASLARFIEFKSTYQVAKTLFQMAQIYLNDPGNREHGRGLLMEARTFFSELGAQRDLAQVEKVIEQMSL